jgi:hypothetical protein
MTDAKSGDRVIARDPVIGKTKTIPRIFADERGSKELGLRDRRIERGY